MRKITCLTLTVLVALMSFSGCAGRQARHIEIYKYGDESRSCEEIEKELRHIQGEITSLIPQADKTARNWLLGTAGYFLIVPYFFMDLSHAEKQEIGALRHRYNHLVGITDKNGCTEVRSEIPDFTDKKAMKEYHEQNKGLFAPPEAEKPEAESETPRGTEIQPANTVAEDEGQV